MLRNRKLAGRDGFEPSHPESNSGVLPLDERPMKMDMAPREGLEPSNRRSRNPLPYPVWRSGHLVASSGFEPLTWRLSAVCYTWLSYEAESETGAARRLRSADLILTKVAWDTNLCWKPASFPHGKWRPRRDSNSQIFRFEAGCLSSLATRTNCPSPGVCSSQYL